jgi:sugar phosphate isomerase/epimerase
VPPQTVPGRADPNTPLRLGIDSYSYHRLLGEPRPGEAPPPRPFEHGSLEVIAHAAALDVDGVSLETCFLPPRDELELRELLDAAGPLELVLAWGHRHGLEFGASPGALADLLDWLELAPALGCGLVRCVAASPGFRGRAPVAEQIERTVAPLAAAAARARELGLRLAVENHGDLRADELLELVERVGDEALGVCLDTANALRVGDDPLEAVEALTSRTLMVHLKDVEPIGPGIDPVAGPCSVPYGEGAIPVASVLATLESSGFGGLVCVELGQLGPDADELELVARSVAWLRDYLTSSKG